MKQNCRKKLVKESHDEIKQKNYKNNPNQMKEMKKYFPQFDF